MITQFHPDSQRELSKRVQSIQTKQPEAGFVKLGDAAEQWLEDLKKGSAGIRYRALERINQRRRIIYTDAGNESQVYELCKAISELAEVDRVNFTGMPYENKYALIRQLVPYALFSALSNGVLEYQECVERQNWRMQWMIDDEIRATESFKDEAVQLSQDVYKSFINDKGLTAEFQAYVANYEITDGQTTQ